MWFRVLGPPEIGVAGRLLPIRRRRERYLLGILALDANRAVSVHRLGELLWCGSPPENARRIVQSHVARLRSVLGAHESHRHGVTLETNGYGYVLTTDPDRVDAQRFQTLLARATASDLGVRAGLLRTALDLWREPLPPPPEEVLWWRIFGHLDELRATAYEDWIAAGLQLGDGDRLIPELARLVGIYPTRERLVEMHMIALEAAGRSADALAAYARAHAVLSGELGIEPGPRLRERQLAILRQTGRADSERVARVNGAAASTLGAPARPAPAPQRSRSSVAPAETPARRDTVRSATGDQPAITVTAVPGTDTPGTVGTSRAALARHWAGGEAGAFVDFAQTWHAAGQPQRAHALYTSALVLATIGHNRYEAARARIGLGHVCAAMNEPTQARQHWAHAIELYRALDLPDDHALHACLDLIPMVRTTDADGVPPVERS
ncbi:BTAD domain-containing putative transcriptional regulator [Virgisporangium aurantiacum]|uniref:DNA-binding transcriptional activator of the SARP family n=1 Tax=Virgisporangium aurantiacum TaxID=175570 RepID=A0A8J3ZL35_9ACTN|nr:BTAD domain-containing putative transcriptional regulator [Virgisporangium aurantiacum]GIJ63975.1 hypothetical protein Vau01_114910 [Virgisporangium aurantiacum]